MESDQWGGAGSRRVQREFEDRRGDGVHERVFCCSQGDLRGERGCGTSKRALEGASETRVRVLVRVTLYRDGREMPRIVVLVKFECVAIVGKVPEQGGEREQQGERRGDAARSVGLVARLPAHSESPEDIAVYLRMAARSPRKLRELARQKSPR